MKKRIEKVIQVIWIIFASMTAILFVTAATLCGVSLLGYVCFDVAISLGLFAIASWVMFVAFIAVWNGIRD